MKNFIVFAATSKGNDYVPTDPTDASYGQTTSESLRTKIVSWITAFTGVLTDGIKVAFTEAFKNPIVSDINVDVLNKCDKIKELDDIKGVKYDEVVGSDPKQKASIRNVNAGKTLKGFKTVCDNFIKPLVSAPYNIFEPTTWGINPADPEVNVLVEAQIKQLISNTKEYVQWYAAVRYCLNQGREAITQFGSIQYTPLQIAAIQSVLPITRIAQKVFSQETGSKDYIEGVSPKQRRIDFSFLDQLIVEVTNPPYLIHTLNLNNIRPEFLISYVIQVKTHGAQSAEALQAKEDCIKTVKLEALKELAKGEKTFNIDKFKVK